MMKFFLLLCGLFFLIPKLYGQNPDEIEISETYSDQGLISIFKDLESRYPINFYFNENWLPKETNSFKFEKEKLTDVLKQLLESSSQLTFRYYNDHAVIIGPREKFKEFSENYYLDKAIENTSLSSGNEELNIPTILIGSVSETASKANVQIRGTVTNKIDGELLPGAVFQILQLGVSTSSGADGSFKLNVPKGNYAAKISSMGYETQIVNLKVLNNGTWNIELLPEAFELDEVIIMETADDNNIHNLNTGLVKLSAKSIKELPTFMGEADVVRSILTLPGINTVGEGATGFNVRGGNIDQNLILLDEIIVFNSSHLLGFFSAFNADAIEEVNIFKGNIPSQYGGRLSSVLDIKSKKGNYDSFKGEGGIGIVSSRFTLDGPLIKDKTALLLSARASYSDWILKMIRNYDIKNSSAFFYDLNGIINHKIKNGNISLSYYQNYDKFRFSDQYGFSWASQNVNLNWNQVYSPDFSSQLSLIYGNLNNSFFNPEGFNGFTLNSGLTYYKAKQTFSFLLNDSHNINAGLEGIRYYGKPEERVPEGPLSVVNPSFVEKDNGQEFGVYINDEFDLAEGLSVSAGIRQSFFSHFGPKQIYIYQDDLTKSTRTILDTLTFTSEKTIKRYHGFEPRLSMKFSLSTGSSLKISYNRLFQYIHLISNTTSAVPMDIWQVSNMYIPPQRSNNYSLGYFKNLENNLWETSVEVFYRDIRNLVEYKDLPELTLNPAIETELIAGKGKAYGVEFFIKKKAGKINGWLSYTYSRSLRKVENQYSDEIINLGNWYPSNFDQPNNLNLVLNTELDHKNYFSANFSYNTGRPVTAPVTTYNVNSVIIPHFSERNQFRIPDYHRLDISYTVKTSLYKRQKYSGSFTFSIYNVYSRRNAFSVYFKRIPQNVSNAYKFSVLGSAFPAITYNFSF